MEKKKTTIITISATLALILLVATATYAYFQADLGNNKEVDVSVSTLTENDRFSFAVGHPLALQADETSFVKGGDSVSDTTTATALLTANNKTNNATKYYYLYLLISQNNFKYTQNENTPELILTITKPDGTELTTFDGLTYKTITDGKGTTIKGFDITTKKGLITIANNRKITTTSTIEEQWSITLTLVNYDVNQIDNLGKEFSSKLIISQDEFIPSPATICSSNQSLDSCVISLNGFVDTLYYHDSTLANGANDNSYRYAGASDNVNNYICLGSEETTCPDANLFRIIGVFENQVKVIRAKSIGTYQWNSESSSYKPESKYWSTSSLNTYLNGEYLTSLGTLAEKIATTTWKVGGNKYSNISDVVPATAYQYEVGSNASTTTVDKKIGLMYVTDYYYSASPSAWTLVGNSSDATKDYRAAKTTNWLYLGSAEWTITPQIYVDNYHFSAFYVHRNGNVYYPDLVDKYAVRPTGYLISSITYSSGTGTSTDPIRIN